MNVKLYAIKDDKVIQQKEVHKSYLYNEIIFKIMSQKYLNDEYNKINKGIKNRTFNLCSDDSINKYERLILLTTYEYGYLKKEDINLLLDAIVYFNSKYKSELNNSMILSKVIIDIIILSQEYDFDYIVWENTENENSLLKYDNNGLVINLELKSLMVDIVKELEFDEMIYELSYDLPNIFNKSPNPKDLKLTVEYPNIMDVCNIAFFLDNERIYLHPNHITYSEGEFTVKFNENQIKDMSDKNNFKIKYKARIIEKIR